METDEVYRIRVLVEVAKKKSMKIRAHVGNRRYDQIISDGYLEKSSQGATMATYTLTDKGMDFVMAVPDDYSKGWFPWPVDIEQAKANIKQRQDIS